MQLDGNMGKTYKRNDRWKKDRRDQNFKKSKKFKEFKKSGFQAPKPQLIPTTDDASNNTTDS